MNLNELRDRAYKIACEHGFHDKEYADKHWLMLIITELSEVVEADRNNRYANTLRFNSDCSFYSDYQEIFVSIFESSIKNAFEDELADVVIRCLDFCGVKWFDLSEIQETIESNEITPCFNKKDNMTKIIYDITSLLFNKTRKAELRVQDVIIQLFGLSEHLGIDLEWHINQKMRYNELRPILHGKEY